MILAEYTYQNVWYRDLSRVHLERAKNPEGNWAGRVVHAILGGIYAVPVVGDLVALVAVTVWLIVCALLMNLAGLYWLVNPKSKLVTDLFLISPLAFVMKSDFMGSRWKKPVITPTLAPDGRSGSFIVERGSVDNRPRLGDGWPTLLDESRFAVQMANQALACSLYNTSRNIPIAINGSILGDSILEYSLDEAQDGSAPDTNHPLVQVRNFSFEICRDFPDVLRWKGSFISPDKEFYIQRSNSPHSPCHFTAFPYPPMKVSDDEQLQRLTALSLPLIQSLPESRHTDPHFVENRVLLFKNEYGVMVALDFATLHTFSWIPTKESGDGSVERPLFVSNRRRSASVIHILGQHFVLSFSQPYRGNITASINFSPAVPFSTEGLVSILSSNEVITHNFPKVLQSIIFDYLLPFQGNSSKEQNDQALMKKFFHRVEIDWNYAPSSLALEEERQARFSSVNWGLFKTPRAPHSSRAPAALELEEESPAMQVG